MNEWEFIEGWKSHNGEFHGDEFDIFNQDAFCIGCIYKFYCLRGRVVIGKVKAFGNYSRTVCVITEGRLTIINVQEVYNVYKQEVHMKEFDAIRIRDVGEERCDVSKEFMEKFLPFQEPVRLTFGHGSADVTGEMSFCKMSPNRVSVEVIVSGNSAIRFEITPSDVPKITRLNTPESPIDVFKLHRVYRHEFDTDKLKQGRVYLISSKSSKVLAHLDEVTVNRIEITLIRSVENMETISKVSANLQTIYADSAYDMGLSFEEVCDLNALDGALK